MTATHRSAFRIAAALLALIVICAALREGAKTSPSFFALPGGTAASASVLTKASGAAAPLDCVREASGVCAGQLVARRAAEDSDTGAYFARLARILLALRFLSISVCPAFRRREEAAPKACGLPVILSYIHNLDGLKG